MKISCQENGVTQAMTRGKSIVSEEKQCFICNSTMNLHVHHIYNGAYRSKSDRDGCWCYLCSYHHVDGNHSVHRDPERARWLKAYTQRKWEERFVSSHPSVPKPDARGEFIKMYGKSYL